MKITSNVKPNFSFYKGNPCTISFVDNIVDNGDGTWTYDQYILTEPWKINLQAQIEAHYDDWLDKAKNEDLKSESEKIRAYRDNLLTEADTLYCNVENWELMNQYSRATWLEYKQTLRDITTQSEFPYAVVWPKKPSLEIDRSKPTEIEVLRAENDILGQTAAQLQLDNMQLNATVDTLGTMAAQSQLDIMALKGGAS